MVIQIRLSDRIDHTPEQIASDSLNRSWCGFDPSAGDGELWQHNRGRWDLNEARIAEETYATFVHDDRTVAAFKIKGYERVSDPGPKATKIALIGEPLTSADPLYDLLVDQPAVHRGRNAINYVADPETEESSESVAGHRAFLLTWNPDSSDWADYRDCVLTTREGHMVDGRWSTGSRRTGIRRGDRVFLLRQGTRGRGLIGSGEAVDFADPSEVHDEIIYTDAHWDNTGAMANYVDVLWDRLVEPDNMLRTDQLQDEFPVQNWTPMASGTEIQPEVVVDLQARWSEHVGHTRPPGEGQGRLVDAARRKAIEDAAQDWLMEHYRDEGWVVRDTRYDGPYDAVATKGRQTLYLEAKGTQSNGDAVLLTRGEVEHARRHRGSCVIGIWSGMRFAGDGIVDQEAGEVLIMPFDPDAGTLTALQYRWDLGDSDVV